TSAPPRPRRSVPAVMATSLESADGLTAVMSALAGHFHGLTDSSGTGLDDATRQDEARRAIGEVMKDLGKAGVVDAEDDAIASAALAEAVGLGMLEALLADNSIVELVIEGPERVLVDRGQGLVPSEARFSSASALTTIARRLVSRNGGDAAGPVLQAWLPEGGFATVILPPVAVGGPLLEIRRGAGATLESLVGRAILSEEAATVLRNAVEARRNVAVVGAGSAGVSEILCALASAIDPSERLVAVGAGASIDLPNVVALAAGGATGASLGAVAQQAARLRADHLLVDGVCDGNALDVFAALTAHGGGGFVGVHATSATEAGHVLTHLARLAGRGAEPTIAALVADAVHVILQVEATDDGPRVTSISEVDGAQGTQIVARPLFISSGGALVSTGAGPSF
ncbi:MAG: CpaF family protein, partial [Myxococcales bacterium]|nr:CpaF family protein [Myxococcales bacterium]